VDNCLLLQVENKKIENIAKSDRYPIWKLSDNVGSSSKKNSSSKK